MTMTPSLVPGKPNNIDLWMWSSSLILKLVIFSVDRINIKRNLPLSVKHQHGNEIDGLTPNGHQ